MIIAEEHTIYNTKVIFEMVKMIKEYATKKVEVYKEAQKNKWVVVIDNLFVKCCDNKTAGELIEKLYHEALEEERRMYNKKRLAKMQLEIQELQRLKELQRQKVKELELFK